MSHLQDKKIKFIKYKYLVILIYHRKIKYGTIICIILCINKSFTFFMYILNDIERRQGEF